jgi:hypothetical protein
MDRNRRKAIGTFSKAAVLGGAFYVLSQIPEGYSAGPPNQIPKLSYAPTIDQLLSDFSLQQQMLTLDLKMNSGAPIAGKAGIGFDDANVNYVLANMDMTQPTSVGAFIAIDTKPPSQIAADTNFWADYYWDAETNEKSTQFWRGTQDRTGYLKSPTLPNGFNWDIKFTKSYFKQDSDQMVLAAQIPNSYMGPGSSGNLGIFPASNGNYGMCFAIGQKGYGKIPGYPFDGNVYITQTYEIFNTESPIPDLLSPQAVVAGVIGIPLLLLRLRKHRVEVKK